MPSETAHLLIVQARFWSDIADALLDGATAALTKAGATFDAVDVPGALEIPGVIAFAAAGSPHYDGFIALGCVMRGETYHFDIVANESSRGLTELAIRSRLAIGNGILTTENEAQAWARARASEGDVGGGAARAALRMIELRNRFGA